MASRSLYTVGIDSTRGIDTAIDDKSEGASRDTDLVTGTLFVD